MMVDENVVVGEVVIGRRIETVLLVSLVHGPEMSVSDAAGLVLEFVSCIPQVRGVGVWRSEEILERQTVTVRPLMDRREPSCVATWPECYSGGYDPRCCRFPKSCSVRDVEEP